MSKPGTWKGSELTAEKNKALREYMKKCGLTYQRAAYILNMSESTVYRLFRQDLTGHQVSEILLLCNLYKNNSRTMVDTIKAEYQRQRKEIL